jgi:CheY-like chemotaxis protein
MMPDTKSILLVEDNSDDELLTLMAFKENNILNTIVVAHDGVEALDYLFSTGKYANCDRYQLPQVVLLDLKLPKISGLEVLHQIRTSEHTRLLPVVILTSSQEDMDLIQSYQLGANSYIRKPVDFEQFSQSIRQISLYWLVLNEIPHIKRY